MPENHTTGEKGDEKQRARRMDRRRGKSRTIRFYIGYCGDIVF